MLKVCLIVIQCLSYQKSATCAVNAHNIVKLTKTDKRYDGPLAKSEINLSRYKYRIYSTETVEEIVVKANACK